MPESLETSKVFCAAPWRNLFVREDGLTSACCMATDQTKNTLWKMSLRDIWNSTEIKQMRLNMLSGRKSLPCSKCYEVEGANAESLRTDQNRTVGNLAEIVARTGRDGSIDPANLTSLELNLSNTCNYRCRYCNPRRSTAWYKDFMTVSNNNWEFPTALTATDDFPGLYDQIRAMLPHLQRISFAGGEPLISNWHSEILEILLAGKRPDVALSYTTNFSNLTHQGADVLALWKRFQHVSVMASLDAPGRRGEYIRKGQEWGQVIRDRERLMRACPHVLFGIAPTLSVMNAFCLPDFHREWLEKGYLGPNSICIGTLFVPLEYRIQILPDHLKRKAVERYQEHIVYLSRRFGALADRDISRFEDAVSFMRNKDLSCLIGRFRKKTRELDEIRKERFEDVFPELAELMNAPWESGVGDALGRPGSESAQANPGVPAAQQTARTIISYRDLLSLDTLQPFQVAEAHLEIGTLYMRIGRLDDAVQEFLQVIRLHASPAESWMDLWGEVGLLCADMGRVKEAETAFRDLLSREGSTPDQEAGARIGLGMLYQRAGRALDALPEYQKILGAGNFPAGARAQASREIDRVLLGMGFTIR